MTDAASQMAQSRSSACHTCWIRGYRRVPHHSALAPAEEASAVLDTERTYAEILRFRIG